MTNGEKKKNFELKLAYEVSKGCSELIRSSVPKKTVGLIRIYRQTLVVFEMQVLKFLLHSFLGHF